MSPWVWLTPSLAALFLYGIGQGLVKKWISEVPPARFCLYFVAAKAVVNLGFFFTNGHPAPFAPEGRAFLLAGVLAYILDGAGWILYFQSIVAGPITIVGTLSAAYPALTVVFARVFLKETLMPAQYVGVALVIAGCLGLSYAPPDPDAKVTDKTWIPLAATALVLWGAAQTIVKYSYGLPHASEVNLALFNTIGGALTLGAFGWLKGRGGGHSGLEWLRSFLPMGMMAGGDLGVILATKNGPVSIVTPLTGAYPLVTLGFAAVALKEKVSRLQWACIAMILVGMYLSPGAS
ncbi:MAG: DMT family transporter [Elusimicrobia bacterium]|nr:DMT family transporter [Elusimicrobiota bacterium]